MNKGIKVTRNQLVQAKQKFDDYMMDCTDPISKDIFNLLFKYTNQEPNAEALKAIAKGFPGETHVYLSKMHRLDMVQFEVIRPEYTCYNCKTEKLSRNKVMVDVNGLVVCKQCYNRYYGTCEDCGKYELRYLMIWNRYRQKFTCKACNQKCLETLASDEYNKYMGYCYL